MLEQQYGHLLVLDWPVGALCPFWGTPCNWHAQKMLMLTGQALLFDEEKITSREDLNLALTDLEDFLSTHSDEVNMICSVLLARHH